MDSILNQASLQELKVMLKKKYPRLTEDDLLHKEGMEVSVLRLIEDKLRKTKQEMREIIAGYYVLPLKNIYSLNERK